MRKFRWKSSSGAMSAVLLVGCLSIAPPAQAYETAVTAQELGTRTDTLPIATTYNAATGLTTLKKTQNTVRLYRETTKENRPTGTNHLEWRTRQVWGTVSTLVWVDADAVTIANWQNTVGRQQITIYAEAGAEAIALARLLSGYSLGNGLGAWSNGSVRGWPLQAAMIHNPEMGNINSAVMLQAWDIVWANVQARGWNLGDPLVLDLDGNKRIDVTGKSAAKYRNKEDNVFVAAGAVLFDILGTKKPIRTEWIAKGEGFLVDNRKDAARKLIAAGKNLTIRELLGDSEGFAGGFAKLASQFDSSSKIASVHSEMPADVGIIKGQELDSLLVWVDDGDGIAKADELKTLSELEITEIRLPARFKRMKSGEFLEQATFLRKNQPELMQEVWFAHENSK